MLLITLLGFVSLAIEPPAAAARGTSPPTEVVSLETAAMRELLAVRRVYVERLAGGESAAQLRDMIIASLQNARLFIITENQERADAVLRGSGEDLVFSEMHSSGDSLSARASIGLPRGSRSGGLAGLGVGESESVRNVERRHEAVAAIRLVNRDGDVIWSATEESMGGKFRGASADVAEKLMRRLVDDMQRARKVVR